MDMKLGICTTDFGTQPVEDLFARIKGYGFSQVQFDFASVGEEELPAAIDSRLINRIRRSLRENQLEIVAINGTFNMIHPDPAERSRGIERFPVMVDAARQLGCRIVTLCTGTNDPDDMWRWHPDNGSEQSWQILQIVMAQLLPVAEQYEVFLGIETEASNVVSSPEKARRIIDEMQSPFLKIVMDCANLFPRKSAYKANVAPMIRKAFDYLGSDIILAHGKDISESDEIVFASPGKGIIDYGLFLELLCQYDYQGGMLLHGIKNESEIPGCLAFMQSAIEQHNM
ncbi:MAG: sugar phosphate isomerase/epimerase [Bacillota bacterium]|nr:sugar phosphate isomerase/epimerase [Bacillota bacterium]